MKSAQRAAAASEGDSAGEGAARRAPRGVDSPLERRRDSANAAWFGSSSLLVAAAIAAGLVAASEASSAVKAAAL